MCLVRDQLRAGDHNLLYFVARHPFHLRQLAPVLRGQHGEEGLREVDEGQEQAEDRQQHEKVLLVPAELA